ncbi:MAG: hypothetical protein Ct9H300mP8_12610 [Gammaproteobacteria bacterium]|nr:MAG: hypothetical protein Ct9H300mP8_12610 [Gammaproteobacteria bacterium]
MATYNARSCRGNMVPVIASNRIGEERVKRAGLNFTDRRSSLTKLERKSNKRVKLTKKFFFTNLIWMRSDWTYRLGSISRSKARVVWVNRQYVGQERQVRVLLSLQRESAFITRGNAMFCQGFGVCPI